MKLTEPQWRFLDRVCRTNGGGVSVGFSEGTREYKMAQRLYDKGLVQGKLNHPSWVVHTREGLAFWREHKTEG